MAGDEGIVGTCVTIRRRVPSQNATHYAHWRNYTKERDTWFVLMRTLLPPRQPPQAPVRMILRSYRTRLVDYANLVGGAKPIPDILIRLGYLRDDSPRWFFCDYQQFQVAKAEERTEIEFIPWAGIDEDGDHG
jgi:hypothetical protein